MSDAIAKIIAKERAKYKGDPSSMAGFGIGTEDQELQGSIDEEGGEQFGKMLTGTLASSLDPGGLPSSLLRKVAPGAADNWQQAQDEGGMVPRVAGAIIGGGGAAGGIGRIIQSGIGRFGAMGGLYAGSDVVNDDVSKKTAGKFLLGGAGQAGGRLATGLSAGVGTDLVTGGKAIDRLVDAFVPRANATPFVHGYPVDPTDSEMVKSFQKSLGLKKQDGLWGGITKDSGEQYNRFLEQKPSPERQVEIERLMKQMKRDEEIDADERRDVSRSKSYQESPVGVAEGALSKYLPEKVARFVAKYVDLAPQALALGGGMLLGSKIRGNAGEAMNKAARNENRQLNQIGRYAQENIPDPAANISTLPEAAARMGPAMAARDVVGQQPTFKKIVDPNHKPGITDESRSQRMYREWMPDAVAAGTLGPIWGYSSHRTGEADKQLNAARDELERNPDSRAAFERKQTAERDKLLWEMVNKFDTGLGIGMVKGKLSHPYLGRSGQKNAMKGDALAAIHSAEAAGSAYAGSKAAQTQGGARMFGMPYKNPNAPAALPPASSPAALPASNSPAALPAPAAQSSQSASKDYSSLSGVDKGKIRSRYLNLFGSDPKSAQPKPFSQSVADEFGVSPPHQEVAATGKLLRDYYRKHGSLPDRQTFAKMLGAAGGGTLAIAATQDPLSLMAEILSRQEVSSP